MTRGKLNSAHNRNLAEVYSRIESQNSFSEEFMRQLLKTERHSFIYQRGIVFAKPGETHPSFGSLRLVACRYAKLVWTWKISHLWLFLQPCRPSRPVISTRAELAGRGHGLAVPSVMPATSASLVTPGGSRNLTPFSAGRGGGGGRPQENIESEMKEVVKEMLCVVHFDTRQEMDLSQQNPEQHRLEESTVK